MGKRLNSCAFQLRCSLVIKCVLHSYLLYNYFCAIIMPGQSITVVKWKKNHKRNKFQRKTFWDCKLFDCGICFKIHQIISYQIKWTFVLCTLFSKKTFVVQTLDSGHSGYRNHKYLFRPKPDSGHINIQAKKITIQTKWTFYMVLNRPVVLVGIPCMAYLPNIWNHHCCLHKLRWLKLRA